ncbi:MAG: ribonuclease HI [Bacteroidetes bacterium]|nr:ribonuclease HI [Bacteroidota bacterium]
MKHTIKLYTDGACSGNPGPGGYGIVLLYKQHRKELSQGYKKTTNNRMELLAVIIGIESIKQKEIPIIIYSDSKYVVDAINLKWVFGWVKIGFKDKANPDLWKRFLKAYNPKLHQFIWVKGHASNIENNRCDVLAVEASKSNYLLIDEGYENKNNNEIF